MSNWIKVDDRLPQTGVRVLLCGSANKEKVVFEGYTHFSGAFFLANSHKKVIENNVTHWQPLPEPPKD